MTCDEYRGYLQDDDRELSATVSEQMAHHEESCKDCLDFSNEPFSEVMDRLAELPPDDLPNKFIQDGWASGHQEWSLGWKKKRDMGLK